MENTKNQRSVGSLILIVLLCALVGALAAYVVQRILFGEVSRVATGLAGVVAAIGSTRLSRKST